ncbi:hypothetical protein SAMN05421538_104273 [Paracoccus isoporae]|uniref:Uncharacterized protein n=1 Tax=Paracoccus isoporae TaxID=591205 RepID=A0A1G7AWP0_9RHOB|nr:hypothetical protein [Paracoccus isoporae]SDE19181.1 hypothetical protein SAMN05421538_104273 [Paracoccus isoporae]
MIPPLSDDLLYLIGGIALWSGAALAACIGLSLRLVLILALCAGAVVALLPALVQLSPVSLGLSLSFALVMASGLASGLRLGWRRARHLLLRPALWIGLAALYTAIGMAYAWLGLGSGGRTTGFALGVQVLGLPILSGLLIGRVLRRRL